MKKGELQSTLLFYSVVVIVVGLVVYFGYAGIRNMTQRSSEVKLVEFKAELESGINYLAQKKEAVEKKSYELPGIKTVCFFDLANTDYILEDSMLDKYPLIKDSLTDGSSYNMFIVTDSNDILPYEIPGFKTQNYIDPYYNCIDVIQGKLNIVMEGTGTVAMIRRDESNAIYFGDDGVAKTDLVLRSSDGNTQLEIPKGTKAVETGTESPASLVMVDSVDWDTTKFSSAFRLAGETYTYQPDVDFTEGGPVKLSIRYYPEMVENEEDVKILWFDETQDMWIALATDVDTEKHIATAEVSHLSTYTTGIFEGAIFTIGRTGTINYKWELCSAGTDWDTATIGTIQADGFGTVETSLFESTDSYNTGQTMGVINMYSTLNENHLGPAPYDSDCISSIFQGDIIKFDLNIAGDKAKLADVWMLFDDRAPFHPRPLKGGEWDPGYVQVENLGTESQEKP